MITLINWTDRNFEFNLPEGLFTAIVCRLAGTPARLEDISKSLKHTVLIKKNNGSWSIKENIGHLLDLEELHMLRLHEYIDKKDELSAADMTNRKTYDADHNNKNIKDILSSFKKARNEYVSMLDSLDNEVISRYSYHPRLKIPMRLIDNAFFAAEHDDHHIATIRYLISIF